MPPWIEAMNDAGSTSMKHPPPPSSIVVSRSDSDSSDSDGSRSPSSRRGGWSTRSVMSSSSSINFSSVSGSVSFVSLLGLGLLKLARVRWALAGVALLTVLSTVEAVCDSDRWWNPERGACVPCTVCGEQQLVLRPCQEYMDTVCGTIGDLDMDVAQLAQRTESHGHEQRHWKEERRKDGHGGHQQQQHGHQQHGGQQKHQVSGGGSRRHENTEEIMWDWQAASLLLAIIGCLLFFLAAAIIALNQTRQWKRIEKHFDADMEALSAQLMNHLTSMQQLENGSIFLDDVIGGGGHGHGMGGLGGGDHRRFRGGGGGGHGSDGSGSTSALLGGHHHHHHHHPIEVRCVYLDQLLDGKNCIQSQGPGNLYIEENNEQQRPNNNGGGMAPTPGSNRIY